MSPVERLATLSGVGFFIFFGGWAFVAPRSFYEVVAPWEPYNEHFLHDGGAFSVGIGLGLLAAIKHPRIGALAGAAGAAVLHALAHVIDLGEGGRSSDPYTLSALALLLSVGLASCWRRSA